MKSNEDDKSQVELLREIISLLRELLTWTRFRAYPSVKEMLATVLDSPQKLLVYDAMDGLRSTREIEKATGLSARMVSEWGQEWEKRGLVQQSRTSKIKGRREKLFDLALLGLAPDSEGTVKREEQ